MVTLYDPVRDMRNQAAMLDGAPRTVMLNAADWIERALEVLRDVEWRGSAGWPTCPLCGGSLKRAGHATDCKLAALIGAEVK